MQTLEFKKNKLVFTTVQELKINKKLKELVNYIKEHNHMIEFKRLDALSKQYEIFMELCYKLQEFALLKEVEDSFTTVFLVLDMEKFKQLEELCNAN